jgi:hypothetical protein
MLKPYVEAVTTQWVQLDANGAHAKNETVLEQQRQ